MKTILNLFLIIILMVSCSVQKLNEKKIIGKYQSMEGKPFIELILSEDNTFRYKQIVGLYNSKSKGTWKLKKNKIVLMSDSSFKTDMIDVSESHNDKKREIKIVSNMNKPYSGVVVKVNGAGLIKMTNDKGIITLDRSVNVSSLEIKYLGESYSYKTLKEDASFNIILYTNNLDNKYFDNEEALVKKNIILLEGDILSLKSRVLN